MYMYMSVYIYIYTYIHTYRKCGPKGPVCRIFKTSRVCCRKYHNLGELCPGRRRENQENGYRRVDGGKEELRAMCLAHGFGEGGSEVYIYIYICNIYICVYIYKHKCTMFTEESAREGER